MNRVVGEQLEVCRGDSREFVRGLSLFDSTMVVVGVMIGSGIFIVPAEMARLLGSSGWFLIAWVVTGALTLAGALSYGELAGMMPRAGGMYVYLREAFSPLWGFLYGWTLFTVIQTATIAAVALAFARFSGVLWPRIAEEIYLVRPIHVSSRYAVSVSTAQLLGIVLIALLTWTNSRGLKYAKVVQNVFTIAKTGAVVALVLVGLLLGWNTMAVHENLGGFWKTHSFEPVVPGLDVTRALGLFVAICVAQTGSLFAADAWHTIGFVSGEVKNPGWDVARGMAIGTALVIGLYMLANMAYLVSLPLPAIQHAPSDRVGTALLKTVFPNWGTSLMAAAIMVSTFGTVNALILTGARAYCTMAREGLFFPEAGSLNQAKVPGWSLLLQGVWAGVLILPRTYNSVTKTYGNLYTNLLEYVISAALIFYALTVVGLFRLRITQPEAPRVYRAIGYPVVPAIYVLGASTILAVLFAYRPATTWPGLVIALTGFPLYWLIRMARRPDVPADRGGSSVT